MKSSLATAYMAHKYARGKMKAKPSAMIQPVESTGMTGAMPQPAPVDGQEGEAPEMMAQGGMCMSCGGPVSRDGKHEEPMVQKLAKGGPVDPSLESRIGDEEEPDVDEMGYFAKGGKVPMNEPGEKMSDQEEDLSDEDDREALEPTYEPVPEDNEKGLDFENKADQDEETAAGRKKELGVIGRLMMAKGGMASRAMKRLR